MAYFNNRNGTVSFLFREIERFRNPAGAGRRSRVMLNDVDIEDHAPRVANAPRPETREQDRQDEALGPSGRSRSRAPAPREAPDAKTDRSRPPSKPEPERRQDDRHEGEAPRGGFISRRPGLAAI